MKIGEILQKKGLISEEQLNVALTECEKTGDLLGNVLIRLNLISPHVFLEVLAGQLGLTFFGSLKNVIVEPEVIKAVPAKYVWHYKFMPLELKDNHLIIAVSDPLAIWQIEDLKLHLGYDIERVLATEDEIMAALRKHYGVGAETIEDIIRQDESVVDEKPQDQTGEFEIIEKTAHDTSVVKLVSQILEEAIESRATDIHLEKFRQEVRVRYRIDGVLYRMQFPDEIKYLHSAIVSRIKIISHLNVIERRLPQDGRSIIKIKNTQVDLRISIIPTVYGENVVIRILPMKLLMNMDDLGFYPDDRRKLEEVIHRPHGIIFLTGPTGSGKTTTLYSCLSRLNVEGTKIITIEDPNEYELNGIMQISVKPEIGLTFASALRSILRHDPDVMMVGEVRDMETAELAIRTSLTGHLMFSTLHTNDACSGAPRLIDIGIEPYLVASSVNVFISQRLIRVICPECKELRQNNKGLPEFFEGYKTYYGRGCDYCKSIGYRGMTAIYEMLFIDDVIREAILQKASSSHIKRVAMNNGFKSLLVAGINKVKEGITTPEEVLRVVEIDE